MNDHFSSPAVGWAEHADAAAVARFIADAVTVTGARNLVVPGGNTPLAIFDILSGMDLPWDEISLMLTDDRQVSTDHPASNFGKLSQAFANKPVKITRLVDHMDVPKSDIVWIGMGADGHIASLFPRMNEGEHIDENSPKIVSTQPDPLPPEAPFARLSFNQTALINTDAIMIVARGSDKKTILEEAVKGAHDLPIAKLIAAASCPITIFWSES